ncbi:hypothetical protein B0A81_04215 [Flavobacterium plurextorum]|uniref:DAGKc domain-containing protein n=1 Tax=Flavobacterium plurextorum TaxID=1114867 RepID=A0ABX4CZH8_9FLAO|nr:diacylglycerol kinase family protein [Flavobacterium plurextorum]OXB10219.1 hypothetical protein B0A81_04215 [Flavobacterium plurextorum]
MIYIHFIVNPISGSGKHNFAKTELEKFFPKSIYKIEVDYSNYKKHAIVLTQKAITKKPHYVVACGGDGTINEVASCLINTEIKLGIIPVGSGNGLASNLSISRSLEKATEIIRKGKTKFIDVGKINEHYFFSNVGVGIDALIIKKYERYNKRTLISYVRATIASSIDFKPIQATLSFNGKIIGTNAFMLFISNSNQMGYGMTLTPNADLNDGFLDLVIVPKLSFLDKLTFGVCVLTNTIEKFKKAKHILIEKINIEMPKKIFLDTQIDGELHNLKTNKIEIAIIKNGLEVLIH